MVDVEIYMEDYNNEWKYDVLGTEVCNCCAVYEFMELTALSRVDHNCKIRARKQRTDVGKYSFVNRTITEWNQLTEGG